MSTSMLPKNVALAFCLFCLSTGSSPAQVAAPQPTPPSPLGFPVPVYAPGKTTTQPPQATKQTPSGPAASLGLPQTTKPIVKPVVPVVSHAQDKSETKPTKPAVQPAPQPKGVVDPEEFQLTPPNMDQLFRAESEATSRERIRKAALEKKIKSTEFPKDLPLPTVEKVERPIEAVLEANYLPSIVCYHPPYFEQRLPERYGFFLPLAQPFVSAGKFYADTLLLPYRMALHRPWQWDCSYISICK